jgi:hypothetical protein
VPPRRAACVTIHRYFSSQPDVADELEEYRRRLALTAFEESSAEL